jgi:hypothetical protein
MANKAISLDELRAHLDRAKERISLEKHAILKLYPLASPFNRDEYAFAYRRAEQIGMRGITKKLSEIAWLPMQLDASAEIITPSQTAMKRWLTSAMITHPSSEQFGNDFIHALARTGVKYGWEDGEVPRLASRIGGLFRDLSCLVGLVYYCTWLTENHITVIELSNPSDLGRTVEELAMLMESPQILRQLRAREQDDNARAARSFLPGAESVITKPKKRERSDFQLIINDDYVDPMVTV